MIWIAEYEIAYHGSSSVAGTSKQGDIMNHASAVLKSGMFVDTFLKGGMFVDKFLFSNDYHGFTHHKPYTVHDVLYLYSVYWAL